MPRSISHCSKWSILTLAAGALASHCAAAIAQERQTVQVGYTVITGLPDDWTHHRVVYSNPGTEEQAIEGGRYEDWLKTVNDPRYVIHQLKRGLPVQGPLADNVGSIEAQAAANRKFALDQAAEAEFRQIRALPDPNGRKQKTDLKKDWNKAMGTAAPAAVDYPAKWSFSTTTASCANDFVVFPTGQRGSSTQASIVAYYNLYAGDCSGTVPLTDWAYDTGGTVSLSPIFALSGNEIALIQTVGRTANLVLLSYPLTPPGTGSLGRPATPNEASSASNFYTGTDCSAPCMYSIPFSNGADDTYSNPYYDYTSDTLWVGDSTGELHEFTPVFNGPPAEVTSGWPVQLVNGAGTDTNQVASPVYDSLDGNVFVGTTTSVSTATGGFLYSVSATGGAIIGASGQLDATNGIRDSPLLDQVAGMLYVFVGRDTTGKPYNSGLFQFATNFTGGSGTEIRFGAGGPLSTALQFDGTFDNTYYNSANSASPSGYLYVCPTLQPPVLVQVPINANVMGSPVTGPTVGGSTSYRGRCSPLTEFFNSGANSGAGADYLLLSVFQGAKAGCTDSKNDGCVMSFDVTTPSDWSKRLAPLGTFDLPAPTTAAVTTGISIDNAATATGASQMYFLTQSPTGTTPCTGICAVQLSQAAP